MSKTLKIHFLNYKSVILSVVLAITSCNGSQSKDCDGSDSLTPIDSSLEQPDSVRDPLSSYDGPMSSPRPFPDTEAQLSYMAESPHRNNYESGILPQMAEEVPQYCEKLLQNDHNYFVIVDKGKMKLFLYDKYGNVEKQFGIACAKNYGTKQRHRDSRTTEGYFNAEGVYDSTEWLFTDDDGYTSPTKGVYGPRFIRVKRPIGIHGTGSPGSIGKRVSHGCIRITNQNILELVKYVEAGTPIIISPGPRDMAENKKANIDMPSVTTEPGGKRFEAAYYDNSKSATKDVNETTVTPSDSVSSKEQSEETGTLSNPEIIQE